MGWEIITFLLDILVTYFTGSYAVLGLLITIGFGLVILVKANDIRYALILSLPVLGFFVFAGWFGSMVNADWIVNLVLIIVALFYGYAILKAFN